MLLDVSDHRSEGFRHPLILMVDELLPDLGLHIADVEVAKLARLDELARDEVGEVGDHVTFRDDVCDDVGSFFLEFG